MRFVVLAALASMVAPAAQEPMDPALRAAAERFYAAQEAEDVPAYLALWASSAQRPQPAQLKFIFDTGDDKFSDLQIRRVTSSGDRAVVRLSIARHRTLDIIRRPDAPPTVTHGVMQVSLTYVRDGGDWKLLREMSATDALADAIVGAPSAAARSELLAAEPELVNAALVTAVARQADARAMAAQYAAAQPVYELALELARRVGDKRAEAEAWQNLGNSLYFQRKWPEALAAYDRRAALERERGDEAGMASALLGTATVLYSQFEYGEAIGKYREALAIQERLHDTPGIATTLISTGNVQFVQGDFAAAITDYRRSRDLFHQVTDTRGEATAGEGLGRTLAAQGDLAPALEAYASVLQEGQARNDRSLQATALQSIGEIHFRLGNLDVARSRFAESRAQFEALSDLPNVGRVWQATAMTDLVAARFAAAEEEYGSSAAVCARAAGPLRDPECIARGIVGGAFAQAAQQHYEAAVSSYRSGIAAFMALNKVEDAARAEVGLSLALAGKKDYAAAAATAGHAGQQAVGMHRDDVLWRALVAEARACRRLPNPQRAIEAAKTAVLTVERMVDAFEERPIDPVAPDTADAYALLAVLQAERGDAKAAFATVEQRRAHALRLALSANERDIHRGMTPSERDEERRLAIDLTSIAAQIHHETALPRPDSARVARLEEGLAAATAARTAARGKLFERLPALRIWRGLGPAASAEEIASTFGSRAALVAEFVVDEEDVLAVTLGRKGNALEWHADQSPISRQVLAQRVTRALDPATLRSADAWHDAAVDLMSAIPRDAWARIAAATDAIIVPDDVLWHVPFEALPIEGGVLADRVRVAYASSGTSLLPPPRAPAVAPALALFVVASPELPAAAKERAAATSPDWTLRPSAAAESEARAVAAVFDSAAGVVTGQAATESAFRDRAAGSGLIHVAAPFRVNSASPLFSPILLAADAAPDDPSPDRDGVLEPRDVMNLDLQARVAVFSDGAALSMRGAAPAAAVVQWSWRASGVPSIVLPRWAADDAVSTSVLEEFYRQLRNGIDAAEALNRARAAVRAREETRAPFFWAGWMLIGREAQGGGS